MPSAAPGGAEVWCALQNRVFAAAEGGGGPLRAVGSAHPDELGSLQGSITLSELRLWAGPGSHWAVLVRAIVTLPPDSVVLGR